jgi:general stress protein 26
MEFKTPQAKAAYVEILRETGRVVAQMWEDARRTQDVNPSAGITIALHTSAKVAEVQLEGLARAISTATEVDVRWSSMMGQLAAMVGGS